MKFIDEVTITVRSGKGGKGCVSFRRERFVPKGGPDGGDGGKGGDVLLQATSRKRTLYHFQFKRNFQAENGKPGGGSQKTGRNGKNIVLEVPPGTVVSEPETGKILKDLTKPGDTFLAAKGGKGGLGNKRFASSINRTPRYAQPGEAGQDFTLKLELKLIADVGLIGLPNAGKSTLISRISSARPKIADYPFTTLTPKLGIVYLGEGREPFCVADIPGLIKGAHEGAGLGIRFLKHIERTRILVHLIDVSLLDPQNPLKAFNTVNHELAQYSEKLASKKQIVALNKIDLPDALEMAKMFESKLTEKPIHRISSLTGKGLSELLGTISNLLENTKND